MQHNYPLIFCYFRIGLVTGMVEPQEVVAWADRVILQDGKLTEEVIELSLSGKLPYSQLIKNLNLYQGAFPDCESAVKLLLAHAGLRLEQDGRDPARLIRGLRLLLAEGFLPASLRGEISRLDALLAQKDSSQAELLQRLAAFLAPYREYRAILEQLSG